MSLQFKSLAQLNKESLNYQYNEQLSMTFYFKLCEQLLNKTIAIFDYQQWKMTIRENENFGGDLITDNGMEWCFILQMRYLDLMNNKLTYHSQFDLGGKDPMLIPIRREFIHKMKNEVPLIMENVEWLKDQLQRRYEGLQNYKEKAMLMDKKYMEIKHLKDHVKDENTLRKNILIKQQLNHSTDDFPISIELSRERQFEKDRFLQSIKRKNSQQELQHLAVQPKKIKYGIEDLVSSLSSAKDHGFSSTLNTGYVLPTLTPHNSSENLSTLSDGCVPRASGDDLIKYNLPKF